VYCPETPVRKKGDRHHAMNNTNPRTSAAFIVLLGVGRWFVLNLVKKITGSFDERKIQRRIRLN